MASLKQVHSARVLRADSDGLAGEGDALVTDREAVLVSVRTADCYPILLVDVKSRVVAAVHAGWRGTAAGIAVAALETMGARRRDIRAAIGPGIGACCYYVGDEVARLFGRTEAGHIDLAEWNRRQLIDAGVSEGNIEVIGQCTSCDAGQYHSFRRDKDQAGRMISYIGLKSKTAVSDRKAPRNT